MVQTSKHTKSGIVFFVALLCLFLSARILERAFVRRVPTSVLTSKARASLWGFSSPTSGVKRTGFGSGFVDGSSTVETLRDEQLHKFLPKPSITPGSIFFMDTAVGDGNPFELSHLTACALESTALANPHSKVQFLVLRNRISSENRIASSSLTEVVFRNSNVELVFLTVQELIYGTVLKESPIMLDLLRDVGNEKSNLTEANKYLLRRYLGDALRFAVLLKYGGIYLDQDIIALKSFDDSFRNAVGCQQHFWEFPPALKCRRANSGVLTFDKNHDVPRALVNYYANHDYSRLNPRNGNHVLNRYLAKTCKRFKLLTALLPARKEYRINETAPELLESHVTENVVFSLKCLKAINLSILDPFMFYPVQAHEVEQYFKPEYSAEILRLVDIGQSTLVHYYRSWSADYLRQLKSLPKKSAFYRLMLQGCPGVLENIF